MKKTLKQNERVIHRLRREREVLDIESDADSMSSSTESLVFHEEVQVVLKLARTIRKQEAVPDVEGNVPLRHPDPDERQRREERSRDEAIEREHREQRRRLEEERRRLDEERRRLQEERQRSERIQEDLRRAETAKRSHLSDEGYNHVRPSPNSSPSRLAPTPDSFESPNLPRDGMLSRDVIEEQDRGRSSEHSHSGEASQQSQRSAPARHPLTWQRILKIKASRSAHRVQGYIIDGDENERLVTAILEPEQTFNFMTDKMASDLSLLNSIEPYTGEEEVETWIESVSGRMIRPLGKIQVQWATGQQSRLAFNSFSLQFWIFPYHPERALVLGEPFIIKSDYYSRRTML